MKQGQENNNIVTLNDVEPIEESPHSAEMDTIDYSDLDIPVLDDLVLDDNIDLDHFEEMISSASPEPTAHSGDVNPKPPETQLTQSKPASKARPKKTVEAQPKPLPTAQAPKTAEAKPKPLPKAQAKKTAEAQPKPSTKAQANKATEAKHTQENAQIKPAKTQIEPNPQDTGESKKVSAQTQSPEFLEKTHKNLKIPSPKRTTFEHDDSNPFLPPHIKERLLQNKKQASQFYDNLQSNTNDAHSEMIHSGHPLLSNSTHASVSQAVALFVADLTQDNQLEALSINLGDSTVAIIDRLTTIYLPVFESQMRQQLARVITQTKNHPLN